MWHGLNFRWFEKYHEWHNLVCKIQKVNHKYQLKLSKCVEFFSKQYFIRGHECSQTFYTVKFTDFCIFSLSIKLSIKWRVLWKGYEKSEIYDFLPLGMLGPRVFLACVNGGKYKKLKNSFHFCLFIWKQIRKIGTPQNLIIWPIYPYPY